jgi:hypothetical protein
MSVARPRQHRELPRHAEFKDKFDAILKGGEKNPTFAPLVPESTGGLGGTSDDVFGPLVSFTLVASCSIMYWGLHVMLI